MMIPCPKQSENGMKTPFTGGVIVCYGAIHALGKLSSK